MYFFSSARTPYMYDPALNTAYAVSAHASAAGAPVNADVAIAAFGRLFICDSFNEGSKIYWSDLLLGFAWTGGTSGSIDLTNLWPSGQDNVQALIVHNGYLVVFGAHSILVLSGADDNPGSNIALHDSISGVGVSPYAKRTVASVGGDTFFLSQEGLQSLGRVIQEKSFPLINLSRNIQTELLDAVDQETTRGFYDPSRQNYLLMLDDGSKVYCFDTSAPLDGGALRVSVWNTDGTPTQMMSHASWDKKYDIVFTLHKDSTQGIQYLDSDTSGHATRDSFDVTYETHPNYFGDLDMFKLPKGVISIIETSGTDSAVDITVGLSLDYKDSYDMKTVTLGDAGFQRFETAAKGNAYALSLKFNMEHTGTGNAADPTYLHDFNVVLIPGRES